MKVERLFDRFLVYGFTEAARHMEGTGNVVVRNTGPRTMVVSVHVHIEVPEELSDDLEKTG